jgi:hypothetical protein
MDTTAHFPSQVRADSTVKAGEIEGIVVSALTDSAIYKAQLVVHGPDGAPRYGQITDDEGRFHVLRRAPGQVVIEARQLGYKTDSVRIDFSAGAAVKIALRVYPMRISSACCQPVKGSVCV